MALSSFAGAFGRAASLAGAQPLASLHALPGRVPGDVGHRLLAERLRRLFLAAHRLPGALPTGERRHRPTGLRAAAAHVGHLHPRAGHPAIPQVDAVCELPAAPPLNASSLSIEK